MGMQFTNGRRREDEKSREKAIKKCSDTNRARECFAYVVKICSSSESLTDAVKLVKGDAPVAPVARGHSYDFKPLGFPYCPYLLRVHEEGSNSGNGRRAFRLFAVETA